MPFKPFKRPKGRSVNYNEGFWAEISLKAFWQTVHSVPRISKWFWRDKWRLVALVLAIIVIWPGRNSIIYAEPEVLGPAPVISVPKDAKKLPESRTKPQKAVKLIPVEKPKPVVKAPAVASCAPVFTGDYRKDFIFNAESTHNPCAINGGGCMGLGQDCNGWLITGRLNSPVCGQNWRSDIACQLAYWDWYAITIYGGWGQAYAFRLTHNYW